MTKHLLRFVAVLALCLGAPKLYAQVTTSAVTGTVTDAATKEALIGASVRIKHLPTGSVQGSSVNAKGNFTIVGLRPGGPYTIEVTFIGYQKVELNNISLSLGETETFNFKLKDDSKALDQLVVTASRGSAFNARRTGAGTNFSRTSIERTPSIERSLFDVAKLSPMASISSNGAVSFAGSNNRYNSFQIDGAVSNDVFGLASSGTNGGQAGATPISLEAIEALQVLIAPFDVRQSGFTGGGINAITKGGTNQFKGSAYAFYKDNNFFGSTPGADVKNRTKLGEQHDYSVGFTLGGPIVKDKLFFFVNAELNDSRYPSRYLAGDPTQEIKKEDADRVRNKVMELTGGYDAGGYNATDVPTRSYKALTRIDWNITSGHRLSLRYSYLDASKYVFSNGPQILRFLNNGYSFVNKTHSLVAELNSTFSSTVSNELRIGYNRIRDHREVAGRPMPSIQIGVGKANIYLGPERNSAANALDQDIFNITDNLTLNYGNHTVTLGTHNEFFKLRNLFIQNNYGAYTYKSIDDFEKVGTPDAVNPINYDYSFSIESVTGSKRYAPQFGAAQLGFYAQDDWKVTDRLRLTYGLRVDIPIFFDKPSENKEFNNSPLAQQHGVKNHTMPSSTPLLSPRLGFRYHLGETRKHLLRGGIGVFTGRIPFVWISNSFSNTGFEFSRTSLREKDFAKGVPGFEFSIDPNKQYIAPKGGPNTEVNMVKKNFKFPQTLRTNLAFETVLPGDIKATIEGMYSKTLNNIYYRNLNQVYSGAYFDHGGVKRPLYKKVDPKSTYLLLLDNTDKGYSYNVSAQLAKDFKFGLSTSIAYTYGKSYGVIDGTSSVASSNWKYNYNFAGMDAMEEALTTFDVRHRIVGTLNYRVEYGKNFATTIGLVYSGQSGSRFSLAYNRTDMNGDGENGNDLMYIPTTEEVQKMKFGNEANRQAFEKFLSSDEQVSQYRGRVAPRNAFEAPFLHKIDLHFAQDFYLNVGGRRHTLQLNADVLNLANLFNRGWGISYSAGWSQTPLSYDAKKQEYSFSPYTDKMWTIQDIDSRWRAQIGIKYIF